MKDCMGAFKMSHAEIARFHDYTRTMDANVNHYISQTEVDCVRQSAFYQTTAYALGLTKTSPFTTVDSLSDTSTFIQWRWHASYSK